jgi:cytochrome c oxidase subunit 2
MRSLPARAGGLALVAASWILLLAAAAHAHEQSTLEAESNAADEIEELWWFMFVVSTIVVIVVTMLVVLAVLRRPGGLRDRLAGALGGRWLIIAGGALVPFAILAVLFALTLETLVETAPGHLRPRMTVQVTGRQWFWDIRYPGTGAVTANEIHVPTRTPVEVEVRTGDVLHSFWVPRLNRKIDLVPGRANRVTFEADEPGRFRGQCAEFCGVQHGNMGFWVVAQEPDEFEAWLANQKRPPSVPADPAVQRGQRVFMEAGCASCHRIAGTEADGQIGPDLTHLATRQTLAAATIPNTRGDLGGWILDPQHIKPGNKMPGIELDGPELQALLSYLETLE